MSSITFINGQGLDAVVILYDVDYKIIVRDVYIQSGERYTMEELPEGRFRLRTYSGKSWNPTQCAILNGPLGRFDSDESFSTGVAKDDFFIFFETSDDGISYPTYEVTLHKVINGNMQTKRINKADFFSL